MKRRLLSMILAIMFLITSVDISTIASKITISGNEVQSVVEEVVNDAKETGEEVTTVSGNEAGQEEEEL